MQITIYTDGACDIHADNKPGGWATILVATDDDGKILKETVLSGGKEMTTNNQMELTAVIEGIKALKSSVSLKVVSDSKYVINTVTQNHQIKKNKRLWHEFFKVAEPHDIEWKFVKGHAGHDYNERCDKLAVAERNKLALNPTQSQPKQQAMILDTPIKIYLSTQYSGKKKIAAWSAVITRQNATHEFSDSIDNITELECVLIGAIEALNHLENDDAVTVYTAQEYLSKGMNEWLDGWLKKDWKNNTDNPVKYQERWKTLLKLTQQRTIYFEFVKKREGNPHFERGKELTSLLIKRA